MTRRKIYGHGSRRLFRVLLACSLLLCLALPQLAAWPMLQEKEPAVEAMEVTSTDTSDQEVLDDLQKIDSGTTPQNTSTEQLPYLADPEAMEKAAEGKRLSGDEAAALYDELMAVRENLAALRAVSLGKDAMIDDLAKDNARMKDETGTKAYMLIDGIVGFSEGDPNYGLGLTVGTRLGNSLMLELGTDYMVGSSFSDILDFGIDDFTFRAGVGWMF